MRFSEFTLTAMRYAHQHPDQRPGQAAFNALSIERPLLANATVAAGVDPFYDDAKLKAFWSFVGKHWRSA